MLDFTILFEPKIKLILSFECGTPSSACLDNFFTKIFFWPRTFFGSKFFLDQNFFLTKNCFRQIFWTNIVFGQNFLDKGSKFDFWNRKWNNFSNLLATDKKNFIYKIFLICFKWFKIDFQNRKWNYS